MDWDKKLWASYGNPMRVAIVHYWLTSMRGGEKVLEALLGLFPQADIFTHVLVPDRIAPAIMKRRITTSFIQKLPFSARHYQKYLPLMPLALEQFDLRGYDLVISSESGPAKGVITRADTLHVCYCHSPMRYLWDFYQDYLEEAPRPLRPFWRCISHRLRQWDVLSSFRVDHFAANSRTVASRIAKHYRREARVIHPPVDVESFAPEEHSFPQPEDFYLFVGQLNAYKRADIAVEACSRLGVRLIVIGEGPERKRLERLAGPTVTFSGRLPTLQVVSHMQRCRALLFPGEEDFGIAPVESLAAGRPVIAYARGGATESIRHGRTGILFPRQDAASLSAALEEFASGRFAFAPEDLLQAARRFSMQAFQESFLAFLDGVRGVNATAGKPV